MTSSRRKKPSLPRRKWTRRPVQKPHSTPKGGKGYRRGEGKKRLHRETEDVP